MTTTRSYQSRHTFTCEHCGARVEKGTHYICSTKVVLGTDNIRKDAQSADAHQKAGK